MFTYETKTFTLPDIPGISTKQIEIHLKLYAGYVDHVNKIYTTLATLEHDPTKNAHLMQELRRRLGFEFNGMRLHELYFGDLEGGPTPLPEQSALAHMIVAQFSSFETWRKAFTEVLARGSGWMILNYDPVVQRLHHNWVTNHDEGHLATLPAVVALDAWEHAYMVDYLPAEKKTYVDAYLNALNWEGVARRFEKLVR